MQGVCAWLDEGGDKLGAKAKEVDDVGTVLGYQGRGERSVRGRAAAGSERCFEECEQQRLQSCVLTIEQEGTLVGKAGSAMCQLAARASCRPESTILGVSWKTTCHAVKTLSCLDTDSYDSGHKCSTPTFTREFYCGFNFLLLSKFIP